ncbi:MAG: trigger factor [Thermotogaceae bacterium]|jgi:trigger factor|nr:trigger factor [Thermotogaceae bacterium]MDN5338132.1 trigger factor [Thermotogaceae bacterium]
MESKLLSKEKNVETVKYLFDQDEIKEEERKVIQSLKQRADIPGFRKGKVPENILRARLGEEYIRYSIAEKFIDKVAQEIVKEKGNELLLNPFVLDYKFENEGLEIEFEIHYKPETTLPDYKKFKLEIPKPETDNFEKYVESRLNELRENNVVLEPKEGKIELGDLVKLNYKVLSEDGKEIYKSQTMDIIVREDDLRPIVKEVIGSEKGKEVVFEREFEDENGEKKKYTYHVQIEEVYKRILPNLDDEFVKTVSDQFKNLEELKNSLREEGEKLYEYYRNDFLKDQALNKLADETVLEISEKSLDRLVEMAVDKMKESGEYREQLEKFDNDEEKLKEEIKKSYINLFKSTYSVSSIAEKENIKVDDSEIDETLKELSQVWNVSFERAKAIVKKDPKLFDEIYDSILKSKVGKFLVENAQIVEVEPEAEKENQNNENESGKSSESDQETKEE